MKTAAPLQETGRTTDHSRQHRQSLSSQWVDLIRDGEPLATRNQAHGYLVSIAMSAQIKGWTESEYRTAIASPDKGSTGLWDQIMRGQRNKPERAYKALARAWETATAYLKDNGGLRYLSDVGDDADEHGTGWLDALADPGLVTTRTPKHHAALEHIASETIRRRMKRVAIPVRQLAEHLGVSPRYACTVLHDLIADGWIVSVHRGSHSSKGATGDASVYRLEQAPVRWPAVGSHRPGASLCEPDPAPGPEQQQRPPLPRRQVNIPPQPSRRDRPSTDPLHHEQPVTLEVPEPPPPKAPERRFSREVAAA